MFALVFEFFPQNTGYDLVKSHNIEYENQIFDLNYFGQMLQLKVTSNISSETMVKMKSFFENYFRDTVPLSMNSVLGRFSIMNDIYLLTI